MESICKLLEYQWYDGFKHSHVYVLTGILVAAFAQFDDFIIIYPTKMSVQESVYDAGRKRFVPGRLSRLD